jgi:hypothetical protein
MTGKKVLEIYGVRGLVWRLQSISDHRAQSTPRSRSGTRWSLFDYARGLVDHDLRCAQGLFRSLPDHSLRSGFLGYMWNLTRIQLRDQRFFRPCDKAHTLSSSKLGDYIGMMHLSVHLSIKFSRKFILDPGTTCLRHLLLGSGSKWAHFTKKEIFFIFSRALCILRTT